MPKARARRPIADDAPVTVEDLVARHELWPVVDAAARLKISKKTLYRERDRERITIVRVGRRSYVTDKELRRYVDDLLREVS